MADSNQGRRVIIAAVDPVSGKTCEIQISHDRMRAVATRSMGQAKECAFTVPFILQHPTAIFEGLRREADDDRLEAGWRCYCGIPICAYKSDGSEINVYRGQVHLIFVNDQGVAYNWRWEKSSPDNPKLPIDHEERFTRQLL